MRFRLWGTRGSIPSPLSAAAIQAKIQAAISAAGEAGINLSDPTAVSAFVASLPYAIRGTAGGDTSCIEVRSSGNLIIFDCGSGIRRLGQELLKEEFGRGQGVAHIFICHTHWDHMMGWPFFTPAFIPGNKFYIYGVHPDLKARFRLQQTAPDMFPISLDYLSAEKHFITLQEGETIQIGQTSVNNIKFNHPGDSYGYRVQDDDGTFIYAGDSEYKSLDHAATQHVVEFFRDADALVFDAMFGLREALEKEDWGHSSPRAGADLATRAGVRRLLLFHHNPYASDEEIWSLRDIAEKYLEQHPERPPCEIIVAYDGLEIELWREAKLQTRLEPMREGVAVHLSGRLVEQTTPTAIAAIAEAAAQTQGRPHNLIVVNLAGVTRINQKGIKALFSARRRRASGPLALCGLSSELRRTFTQMGAINHFAIFDTPREALLALKQRLDLHPGQTLNKRYKINKLLTRSPLGDLYRATDRTTRRQVTILVICPSLGPASTQALVKTAQTAANLRHPFISDIFDVGQDGHIKYLALEHTPGRSIRQLINSDDTPTAIPPAQAVRISLQTAQALEYAHSQGVVHGDLKPQDVILTQDNSIQISNFGIGRLEIDKPLHELPAYMGALNYLAPEQLQGHGNSPSSDLYTLGAILYEMLTGTPPFAAPEGGTMATDDDQDSIILQLRQSPLPPRRRNPNLSRSLEHIVLNLLQKSPQERPPNASVVRRLLSSLNPQLRKSSLPSRDTHHQRLYHYLERVTQGGNALLVAHGQKGVGKSQMVLSAAAQFDRATTKPLNVLYGQLFADEDSRPYKVFVRAMQNTLLHLPAHQLSRLLNDLGDLARPLMVLIPNLRPALSTVMPTSVECARLEQAICETLRLIAIDRPVLLILDDLQWIDIASLKLLYHLVRQKIPYLLIVALHRIAELNQDYPLHTVLNTLEPWIDEQLYITPLDPIDTHQMTSSLGAQVPPDFGLWLYSKTEGNLLHIEQLIQVYLEGPSQTRHPLDHSGTTTITLEEAILRRLERLPDSTLATLRQAAILGHIFRFGRLLSALDQPEQEILAHLSNALQAGLIHGRPVEDRYNFSHPLIREVIYSEMLQGIRQRYHQRAAHALEQEGMPGQLDKKIDLLAHHYLRAGQREQALTYLARASRRARTLCAYKTALDYINQALAVIDQLSQTASNDLERQQRQKQRDDLLAARGRLQVTLSQKP